VAARDYRRQLLLLNQKDRGFEIDTGRKPTGFARIQTKGGKGLLTFIIQNLRDIKEEGLVYKGFIAAAGREPVFVNTGTIPVDGSGKGEGTWGFEPANVGGTGYSLDKFSLFGIAVYRPEDGKYDSVCLISDGKEKLPEGWKEILNGSVLKTADKNDGLGAAEEPERELSGETDEALAQRMVEDTVDQAPDKTPDKAPAAVYAELIRGLTEGSSAPDRNSEQHWIKPGPGDYIRETLKHYPKVQPFENPVPGCHWWRINSYDYLFGIMYDGDEELKYYAYGIPGTYQTQAQMQMETYGFSQWRSRKGSEHGPGNPGYWLAFVDAKTGVLAGPE